jgi:shikimate kinase
VRTLWLIGMMGSGKSTVGPRVAEALGADFVDLDQVVAMACGSDITRIFEEEGEEAFRAREREALEQVAGCPAVIACGGGIVEDPANIEIMQRHGRAAWLDAPVAVLAERVGDGAGRPLLAGDARDRIRSLQRRRRKKYEAAAGHRFDAGKRDPEEIAREVVDWWRSTL